MATSLTECFYCGKLHEKRNGSINRARKNGDPLYCSKECIKAMRHIMSDQCGKTEEELKQEKRDYDKVYRSKNREMLKGKKKAYYQKNKEKIEAKMKVIRQTPKYKKKRKEYLATDKYKNYKHAYDRVHRCKKKYGEFWEAASILIDLEKELTPHKYETRKTNGTLNKALQRSRDEGIKRSYS